MASVKKYPLVVHSRTIREELASLPDGPLKIQDYGTARTRRGIPKVSVAMFPLERWVFRVIGRGSLSRGISVMWKILKNMDESSAIRIAQRIPHYWKNQRLAQAIGSIILAFRDFANNPQNLDTPEFELVQNILDDIYALFDIQVSNPCRDRDVPRVIYLIRLLQKSPQPISNIPPHYRKLLSELIRDGIVYVSLDNHGRQIFSVEADSDTVRSYLASLWGILFTSYDNNHRWKKVLPQAPTKRPHRIQQVREILEWLYGDNSNPEKRRDV